MSKRKQSISEYLAEIGRRGGAAKVPKGAAKLNSEERAKLSRAGVEARKAKAAQLDNSGHANLADN